MLMRRWREILRFEFAKLSWWGSIGNSARAYSRSAGSQFTML